MFTRKIFRDPALESGGGGASPAITAPAPASPMPFGSQPHSGPTSYGGSSMEQLWQDPHDPKYQTQPQPPAGLPAGNKTPAAPAAGEGGSQGQPLQGGNTPAPDTSSTATAPGQAPVEVKGALSPDDKAYWTKKDPAFSDMPDHPAVAKMSGQYRDLETKFNQGQQYLGVVNQTIEDYKAVLQSGDPAEIAKMVEHFGGEAKFDTRTSADVVKELEGGYTSLVQALQSVAAELPEGSIPVLNRVLNHMQAQTQAKVGEITRKQELKAEVAAMAKAAGITPIIGNPNERYKASAQANMTVLERETGDANFWEYYNEIKGAFAPGGMFHAQGVTAGKAFGASIDSARYYMALAKGQWLAKNMDSKVLPAHEQAWLKKQQGNSAAGAPPKGSGPANAGAAQDPTLSAMEARMADHMKRFS